MGRQCRGSHRTERNRNRALQPEHVCESSFELLPSPGDAGGLTEALCLGMWLWCCSAPEIRSHIPEQCQGRLPCALVPVARLRFGCTKRPGQRASPSQPSPCRA